MLFTAFEPSGDDHAAVVIAELKRRHPGLPIYAWGGPKMERAGATLIGRTGDDAVMGVPGLAKILQHRRINRAVARWLDANPVAVHVPVDSPAANFPLSRISKRRGAKVVHLVAPQIWAWGRWRIRKLRRLTDLVLCLLPFEEEWFMVRGVPAKFIGHPLFDERLDEADLDRRAARLGGGGPRVALMPGSRPAEIRRCFPVLLDAVARLKKDFPQAAAAVAATRPQVAEELRREAQRLGGWPQGLSMVAGDTDAVVRWCEYALVVSGTVTLQIARQQRPMAAFYRPSWAFYWLFGWWIISTPLFALPNLIAGRRIILELVPHFSNGEALAVEVIRMMRQPGYADDQRRELGAIVRRFEGHSAGHAAAEAIEKMAGIA